MTLSNISPSWNIILENEFSQDYYKKIQQTITHDINAWEIIFPPLFQVFDAFEKTPLNTLKIVILWQDPYHWEWQAHGLSFSVQDGMKLPPSLKNIYKEMEYDLWLPPVKNGNLQKWTSEWVLLLNAILTVKAWLPASHSKIGWETFTDHVIEWISHTQENIIFILWWNFARSKKILIDAKKHFIIESPHPSPFSAYNWFFGSKPFSKANEILKKIGKKEIDWKLE